MCIYGGVRHFILELSKLKFSFATSKMRVNQGYKICTHIEHTHTYIDIIKKRHESRINPSSLLKYFTIFRHILKIKIITPLTLMRINRCFN